MNSNNTNKSVNSSKSNDINSSTSNDLNSSDSFTYSLSYDVRNSTAYNPNSNNVSSGYNTGRSDLGEVPGNRVTSDCISYSPSSLELLFPSPIIISTLCVSTDKTSLFITSLIRLLFYIILYHVLDEIMDLNHYRAIEYVLLILIAINVVYLGLVVSKSTVFSIGSGRSMFELTEFKGTGVNAVPPSSLNPSK